MNKEQRRIAIAESCGWIEIEPCTCCDGVSRGYQPTHKAHKKHLPDYFNDLNAMHEAEQTLWEKDWTSRHDFIDKLARIISPTHGHHKQSGIDLLDATAAERAEAFLRAINKWEETKL
jgi:hypothetical protein